MAAKTQMRDLALALLALFVSSMPGFAAAAAVRHASHDPLLPDALRPAGWAAEELRQSLQRHDSAWQLLLRQRIRERARG